MDHFTVLPFLLAMFIAVAAMPTHVVDVHRQGMGIEHEQPWRSTALASMRARVLTWRTRLRAWLRHPAAMPAAAVLLLLLVAAVAPVPADGASLAAAAALPNVRQIRQDRADNESAIKACAAAQAKLKTEARGLFAVAADKRTPEQKDRLTAIDAQLDVLVAQDAELTATAATIATELQRAERYVEEERGSGSAAGIQVGVDHATERPWGREIPATASAKVREALQVEGFGEFLQAVAGAATPGRTPDPRLFAAISGASTSVPADGGHLVRQDWNEMLLARATEQAVLAPLCTPVPVGDEFDGVELPYIDETSRANGSRWGGVRVYRAAEADSVTATKPKVGRHEIRLEDLNGLMYATDRSLRDARSLGALGMAAFASEYAFVLDDEIVRGTGVGQCKGVISSAALSGNPTVSVAKTTGQAADTFTQANISDMWARLHPRHKKNSVWAVNHELGPQLDVLSIPAGTAALEPRFVSYGPDGVLRIKGRPVLELEQCSAIGDQGDVIVGDFSQFLLASKDGIQQAESIHVRFIFNERTFRWTHRVNGQPAWRSAVTPYKGTSGKTLSPFVTLDAR